MKEKETNHLQSQIKDWNGGWIITKEEIKIKKVALLLPSQEDILSVGYGTWMTWDEMTRNFGFSSGQGSNGSTNHHFCVNASCIIESWRWWRDFILFVWEAKWQMLGLMNWRGKLDVTWRGNKFLEKRIKVLSLKHNFSEYPSMPFFKNCEMATKIFLERFVSEIFVILPLLIVIVSPRGIVQWKQQWALLTIALLTGLKM